MLTDNILSFYQQLEINTRLPRGIHTMNPYKEDYVFDLCQKFYGTFYADNEPRTLMLGINPGRFGSGATGISFTDPIRLEKNCGIPNTLNKKPELSSDFIYRMIDAYGGPVSFYKKYFISAVSPLGFTKGGRNINYYDEAKLQKAVTPFVIHAISRLLEMNINRLVCYCIGEGKNMKFLEMLNKDYHWFERIHPLPHPRFIMQYKRKQMNRYIGLYVNTLKASD